MTKRITGNNPAPSAPTQPHDIGGLLASLREVIQIARQQAVRAVDLVQVRTCWTVGRHIVEYEQGGEARAEYGARLLPRLAERLTAKFGKGFDERNLWHMCRFYRAFPTLNAVRTELSWTHCRSLLRVEDAAARLWYMNESADQNWNTRALDRQIGTLYYERLLASQDRQFVGRVSGFSRNPTVPGRQLPLSGYAALTRPTRLLDFCGHEPDLRMYKNLCRHYWDIDPAATAYYINAYREYWDSDAQEGQA